jgi:hypothetical protein
MVVKKTKVEGGGSTCLADYNKFLYGKPPNIEITKENTLYKIFKLEMMLIYYTGQGGGSLDPGMFPETYKAKVVMMYKIQDCINAYILQLSKDEKKCIKTFEKFAVNWDEANNAGITNKKDKIYLISKDGSKLELVTINPLTGTFTGFLEKFSKCLDQLLEGRYDHVKIIQDLENEKSQNAFSWGKYDKSTEIFTTQPLKSSLSFIIPKFLSNQP